MAYALKTAPSSRRGNSTTVQGSQGHVFRVQGNCIRLLDMHDEASGSDSPSNSRFLFQSLRLPLNNRFWDSLPARPHHDRDAVPSQGSWSGLLAYLDEWGKLPPDWDGDGGHAPSAGVLKAAREMISSLRASRTPVPRIYVAGDGEVGLRWESDAMYASASFVDDGDLLLYMHQGDDVLHDVDTAWTPELDLAGFFKDIVRLA